MTSGSSSSSSSSDLLSRMAVEKDVYCSEKLQQREEKMTGLIVRMIIIAIVALASFFSSYRASSYFDTATGLAYFPAESQTARQQLSASENMSNRSNTRTRTCIPRTYPYPIRYYGASKIAGMFVCSLLNPWHANVIAPLTIRAQFT